jgi:NitT/TauT family transport system permease protein
MKKLYYALPHAVFAALVFLILTPSAREVKSPWEFLAVVIIIEIALICYRNLKHAHDIALLVFVFLALWQIVTTKTGYANAMLYPLPENVFALFIKDWKKMILGIFSSLWLLVSASVLAFGIGLPLGMLVGWFERPRKVFLPIAKVISPIPALIYTPYAVALLPNFRTASIFIIFSSVFWPTFMRMVVSVSTIDHRIVESAKTLNVSTKTMFLKILFPYSIPSVLNGMPISVTLAFMVLTAAEMLGATAGLGWYVKYYSDFGDYTRVVAGIILIGAVVTMLNRFMVMLHNSLIKWR